jgi:hypothetical protein
MGKNNFIGHRAKLSEAILTEQSALKRELFGQSSVDLTNEEKIREHLSGINYESFETIQLENEKPVERDALCGREWIEEHLDYTRRYKITQAQIDSGNSRSFF